MKTMTFVLVTLMAALASVGFNCINDSFQVAVNLPIVQEYPINPGPAGAYGGSAVVKLKDIIDQSYLDHMKNVRSYDIRVSTIGQYSGNVSGSVTIDGNTLLTYSGAWNQFNTPQSVLGTSGLVSSNSVGVQALLTKLNQFTTNQNVTVAVTGAGTIAGTTVPAGLVLRIEILSQVDAEISS